MVFSLYNEDVILSLKIVTTNLSAAAAGLVSALFTYFRYGKVDASMTINGALAGLVSITAGAAYVGTGSAVVIGAIAGVLIVIAIEAVDKLYVDDPVGAIAVHGLWQRIQAFASTNTRASGYFVMGLCCNICSI